ncbi:hypothetical protein EC847_10265 [Scandinavium goeteborgense]|uniref:Uncharacterized protein n=1 Tax=Scandinavium goeteborgense TaxID=1851514 RepID=A0A4R6EPT2_SCAGO|nr:hypothetical protein EC847_10265 [Scandinavium goeteborgense]
MYKNSIRHGGLKLSEICRCEVEVVLLVVDIKL